MVEVGRDDPAAVAVAQRVDDRVDGLALGDRVDGHAHQRDALAAIGH